VYFIQEMHCTEDKKNDWWAEWGYQALFSCCTGWSTVHEYEMTRIVDDSDNGKKMLKAKAHLKLSVSRYTPVTPGFTPKRASVIQDSGPNQLDGRSRGLSWIPRVDSQSRIRVRPGNCFRRGRPGQWRA